MKHEAGHLTTGEPRGAPSAENFMRLLGGVEGAEGAMSVLAAFSTAGEEPRRLKLTSEIIP